MKVKMRKKNNKFCAKKLWFLCNALHNISTVMHVRFEHVLVVDDKVIFQTCRKCCKNFNQRELIDNMRYSYGSFTLHSVLLQQTQMPSFKLIRLEMTKLCPGLRTILMNFLIQGQITPLVLVRLHP